MPFAGKYGKILRTIGEFRLPNGIGSFTAELLPPVLEWWELYNPNGIDTVTAAITNPNDTAVDVSYDLVYYKDGAEVARSEYFTNFSICLC